MGQNCCQARPFIGIHYDPADNFLATQTYNRQPVAEVIVSSERPMHPSSQKNARLPWQPPVVKKLPIATATRSTVPAKGAALVVTHPEPPPPAASKLGFSMELAFPLSARMEE
jgi:hypothetical protein